MDTAGLRETQCAIEQEGIRRTEKHVEKADVQILILDASSSLDDEETLLIKGLDPQKSILVLNKTDLGNRIDRQRLRDIPAVAASLLTGTGVDAIRQSLARLIEGKIDLSARPHAVISERHRILLVAAMSDLDQALELLRSPDDQSLLAAAHLRDALDRIGEATGRVYHDELLDNIFSRFCIGK